MTEQSASQTGSERMAAGSPRPLMLRVGDRHAFEFLGGHNDLALFAAIGAAMAEIQSFELHVHSLLDALAHKTGERESSGEGDELYTKTLGTLIRLLKARLPDDELADCLDEARERRNHIVHRILRAYGWPLMTENDYIRAIKETERARETISVAGLTLSRYLKDRSLVNIIAVEMDPETGDIVRVV